MMEQAVLSRLPASARFEIIPELWLPALREGARIASWVQPAGARWWPVGSPLELLDANLAALASELPPASLRVDPSARVAGEVTGPAWIGAGAVISAGARVGPNAVVSREARVGVGARLENAVALPEANVAAGARLTRAVAFGDEVWRDE
jgi:NDP-sugar pyrophosphorylase family protein